MCVRVSLEIVSPEGVRCFPNRGSARVHEKFTLRARPVHGLSHSIPTVSIGSPPLGVLCRKSLT